MLYSTAQSLNVLYSTSCHSKAHHSLGAGNPKGVVLTHHTLVTAVASLQGFVDLGSIKMGPNDSFLSFLTLAHIFDRVVEEFMLSVGGHIGYWQVGPTLIHSGYVKCSVRQYELLVMGKKTPVVMPDST